MSNLLCFYSQIKTGCLTKRTSKFRIYMYTQFLLFTVVMFYKHAPNTELVNTDHCPYGKYRFTFLWVSRHTFLSTIQYIAVLYVCSCLKALISYRLWFINVKLTENSTLLMPECSWFNVYIFYVRYTTAYLYLWTIEINMHYAWGLF